MQVTSPEISLAKINVAKEVWTLAGGTIFLNWLTRMNKGWRIRDNSILSGNSSVRLFYFLHYVIFFLIFNRAIDVYKRPFFSEMI